MMNEVETFYNRYNYPKPNNFGLVHTLTMPYTPRNEIAKQILVIGCGTLEAFLVAKDNPLSTVCGIDLSRASIRICKSIKRHFKQHNLSLNCRDYMKCTFKNKFDYIVMSGVLHHNNNPKEIISKINHDLKSNGKVVGFVYSDQRPELIKKLNKYFRNNNYTVDQVKVVLKSMDVEWYNQHDQSNEEIADTWLHPYFEEYDTDRLYELFVNSFEDVYVKTKYDKVFFEVYK